MDVDVEESRCDGHPAGIENRYIRNVRTAEMRDLPITNDQVAYCVDISSGIDKPSILHEQIHQPPNSRYRIAIRTATPAETWSRMTEYGPSATSVEISTPRFIGPGCM